MRYEIDRKPYARLSTTIDSYGHVNGLNWDTQNHEEALISLHAVLHDIEDGNAIIKDNVLIYHDIAEVTIVGIHLRDQCLIVSDLRA